MSFAIKLFVVELKQSVTSFFLEISRLCRISGKKNLIIMLFLTKSHSWICFPFSKDPDEVDAKETIKTHLWDLHFTEYGRGVCMYRTAKTRDLVMKVLIFLI